MAENKDEKKKKMDMGIDRKYYLSIRPDPPLCGDWPGPAVTPGWAGEGPLDRSSPECLCTLYSVQVLCRRRMEYYYKRLNGWSLRGYGYGPCVVCESIVVVWSME